MAMLSEVSKEQMGAKKYVLKPKDIRFLKAVDYIIENHKELLCGAKNESLLSVAVFGKRNVIAKIRASQRGVSQSQIEQLATRFNLDYNYFYRDDAPLKLKTSWQQTSDPGKPLINCKGGHNSNILNSQIHIYFNKAKALAKTAPQKMHKDYANIIETIERETSGMEKQLQDKIQELQLLQEQNALKVQDLQTQLIDARKSESEVMKKYIAIRENGAFVDFKLCDKEKSNGTKA